MRALSCDYLKHFAEKLRCRKSNKQERCRTSLLPCQCVLLSNCRQLLGKLHCSVLPVSLESAVSFLPHQGLCRAMEVSELGQADCQTCSAGTYTNPDKSRCLACPLGLSAALVRSQLGLMVINR